MRKQIEPTVSKNYFPGRLREKRKYIHIIKNNGLPQSAARLSLKMASGQSCVQLPPGFIESTAGKIEKRRWTR